MPPDLPPSPPDPAEQPTLLPPNQPSARTESPGLPEHFGRYRIQSKVGDGGMGAVYLADDTELNRPVALKVPFLNRADAAMLRARFLHEARAAAALQHPNICAIHDLGEIDGIPYLTMPFIKGEPLSRKLGPGKPLPVAEAVRLARTVALALQAAHERGVIHRDLKPANIMVDERGEPVVMDFGLAGRTDPSTLRLTQPGQIMGTPAYMAPEQIAGQLDSVGPASDIYSLGVVLYELLTGTTPFQGDLLALASQIALDPPPVPSLRRPGIDPRLDIICLKALAKKPGDRWESMQELAAALADCRPPEATAPGLDALPANARAQLGTNVLAGPVLTLRVYGTPYIYRPAPGQDVITVGRQRRRLTDPPDHGCDFVVRVAGDDPATTRISRRHCEIYRAGTDYYVIDRSKAGSRRNGQPLAKHTPTLLKAGDRLTLAGLVTLEVILQQEPIAGTIVALVQAPAALPATEPLLLEASLGDMLTAE